MSGFVTYAQNFEDLMIWRAVRDVTAGFYIDVGAADPDEDSVTRAFYDRGWRGINIEPSPNHFAALAAARPRDVNLNCLVGAKAGRRRLYNIPDTGLSTVKRSIAKHHATEGFESDGISVPMRTLSDICRAYAASDIHFVKIDVEGAEREVLEGADFNAYRPWIVLLEATAPLSQVENWEAWNPLLMQAEYRFVWFDGLNRFYVAAEHHAQLSHAFRTPPNVFDQWVRPNGPQQMQWAHQIVTAGQASARLREETFHTIASLQNAAATAGAEAHAARMEAHAARTEAASARGTALAAEAAAREARLDAAAADGDAHAARRGAAEAMGAAANAQAALAEQQIAFHNAQQDAADFAARAAEVHTALQVSQRLVADASSESENLRIALADARTNGLIAAVEIERLAGVQHARDEAEAMLAAIYRSTSWRLSAPIRMVRRLTSGGRRAAHNGGAKRLMRRVYYIGTTCILNVPGGRRLSRILYQLIPAPIEWLALRYRAYDGRSHIAPSLPPAPVATHALPPSADASNTVEATTESQNEGEALHQAASAQVRQVASDATCKHGEAFDFSEEEARVFHQLVPTMTKLEATM